MRKLEKIQEKYRDDPVAFNRRVLKRKPYWWRQEEICQSILDYRITVAFTGNSTGKDYLLGGIIPWWWLTRTDSLTMVTGVSQTLLGSVTFKEVRRAIEGSKLIRELMPKMSRGMKASPQVLEMKPGWHVLGFSTTNVERASGQHSANTFAVINEASGVEDHIFDAVDSWGYRKLLVFGNPLRADGRFVELIHQAEKDRQDGIPKHLATNAIQIPSTDSPHAEWEHSPYGLADKTWLEAMYRKYGVDSLWVRSHIKAEIPVVSADTLIEERWLDFAAAQPARDAWEPLESPLRATRRISCDLGEGVGRDSSCIMVRDDLGVREVVSGSQLGLAEAANWMHRLGLKWDVPATRMTYDRMGIGRDMPNHLAKHGLKLALGYAGDGKPSSGDFTNLRSEAAWKLRQRLNMEYRPSVMAPLQTQRPFGIPPGDYWPRLREELKALTYSLVGRRTKLLPKKDWCEILGRSPDTADALIQSFAFP